MGDIVESLIELLTTHDISSHTAITRRQDAHWLYTQLPGRIEGWSKTFTVETRIPYEGSCTTRVFPNERPGICNRTYDIPYFRLETHKPSVAVIHHLMILATLYETVGFHPTETFERHCKSHENPANDP